MYMQIDWLHMQHSAWINILVLLKLSSFTVHPESIHSASLFPHFVVTALFQNGIHTTPHNDNMKKVFF